MIAYLVSTCTNTLCSSIDSESRYYYSSYTFPYPSYLGCFVRTRTRSCFDSREKKSWM